MLIGLLFCFQQFAGGFVGVWGFLVFLRMAVAGLIVGWLASGRYLRLTPDSWLRSLAALRGWKGCCYGDDSVFGGLVTESWSLL